MLTVHQTVVARHPVAAVFAYLADFTTTDEWDPRATGTRRVEGDGSQGSRYACDLSFLGRTVPMVYTVTVPHPPHHLEWVGRTRSDAVLACDTVELTERVDGGTRVDYTASVVHRHLPHLADAVFALPFRRLCHDARRGLEGVLRD